jgi:hypothetical protein
MVEEARPEVGLRASHAMAMSLYTSRHTSNMQIVMRLYVLSFGNSTPENIIVSL